MNGLIVKMERTMGTPFIWGLGMFAMAAAAAIIVLVLAFVMSLMGNADGASLMVEASKGVLFMGGLILILGTLVGLTTD